MWSVYSGQTLVRDFLLVELERTGTPLDIFEAASTGNLPALQAALDASPDAAQTWSPDGWTPLHLAAAFGTPEAVKLLQPLHATLALGRNPETIQLLLAAGADPNARQTAGYTAMFSAAAANRRDLAEILIAHGADPALQNDFGQTAATFARERNHTELADWLESL
jgi:ankyrin repeat protein